MVRKQSLIESPEASILEVFEDDIEEAENCLYLFTKQFEKLKLKKFKKEYLGRFEDIEKEAIVSMTIHNLFQA